MIYYRKIKLYNLNQAKLKEYNSKQLLNSFINSFNDYDFNEKEHNLIFV